MIDFQKYSGQGWRSYAAGALFIIWGGAGIYLGIHGPDAAIAFIGGGLTVIGIRGKLETLGLPQEVLDKLKEK